jgi:hypothetical protein
LPRPKPAAKSPPVQAAASPPAQTPLIPSPVPAGTSTIHYESRIAIIEAWQYGGSVRSAPDFIDRNWVGFDERPILRVPLPARPDGEPAICRIGDYVVRQVVTLASGVPPEEKLEVWQQAEFERLFIPKRPGAERHGKQVDADADRPDDRSGPLEGDPEQPAAA